MEIKLIHGTSDEELATLSIIVNGKEDLHEGGHRTIYAGADSKGPREVV